MLLLSYTPTVFETREAAEAFIASMIAADENDPCEYRVQTAGGKGGKFIVAAYEDGEFVQYV